MVNFAHGLLPDYGQLGSISSHLGDGDCSDTCTSLDGIFLLAYPRLVNDGIGEDQE